jgi:hypothetical protein
VLVSSLALAACLALAATGSTSGCSVGDQSCLPGYNQQELNDACPYGPPGGPQLQAPPDDACPPPGDPLPTDDCGSLGWDNPDNPARGVWQVLAIDEPTRGRCAAAGCHSQDSAAKGIALAADDAAFSAGELKDFRGAVGRPYVELGNKASWIACNLRGDVGAPMPYGDVLQAGDLALVEEWLRCGAPESPTGASGGGGAGGGGGGGAGGS